jgi:DNA adenine methylase
MPNTAQDRIIPKPTPILKWAGGKRQLLEAITQNKPSSFNRYFEPFIGGGAVFFNLQHHGSYISDTNEALINLYTVIQNKARALIEDLKTHENTQAYFLRIRAADRDPEYCTWSDVQKASRFIYLNKTCFNGLYRVNRLGQFNVPYGHYSNPRIVDEENILSCSQYLADTVIRCADFSAILEEAQQDDFIYCDPPYIPLNPSSSFTAYTKEGFGLEQQYALRAVCESLHQRGAKFLLSNSDTPLIHELYSGYEIHTVFASRAINATGSKRGKVSEVLIKNYE